MSTTAVERVYDNLNDKQATILKEFRTAVSDIVKPEHDDFYLLRWLVARNFHLAKAESMLRNHMVWRARVGADTILDDYEPPEVLKKYFTGGAIGRDKEGALLWIEPFGNIDLKGIVCSAMKRDIEKYQARNIEWIYRHFSKLSSQENRRISCLANIFDLENFGLRHLWGPGVDVFNDMLSVFEEQYPETLKVTYVVNAPAIFPIAYKLVSPFLSQETRRKTKILGRNYKQELLKYIDADQLPVYYGGTKTDSNGDPKCSSQVSYGGTVPRSYYLTKLPSHSENCSSYTINRGSSLKLKYQIATPGTVIRWLFTTDNHDVEFGIYRQTASDDDSVRAMETILHSQRVNSHLVPEDGSITCTQPGTYVFVFDNTYSWLHSKTLHSDICVLDTADSDMVIDQFRPLSTSDSFNSMPRQT